MALSSPGGTHLRGVQTARGRMVLAHDTCCYIDWFAPGRLDGLKNWHYLHVSQDVLPYLREHGVPQSDIDLMLTANPARILAG